MKNKRKIVYSVMLTVFVLAHIRVAVREADYYRYRGDSVQSMLDIVSSISAEEDINVLSCLYPNTEGDMTLYYWMMNKNFNNVKGWNNDEGIVLNCEVKNIYSIYSDEYESVDYAKNADIIIAYNREDRHWCHDINLDLTDYTLYKSGTIDIYLKKGLDDQVIYKGVQELRYNI